MSKLNIVYYINSSYTKTAKGHKCSVKLKQCKWYDMKYQMYAGIVCRAKLCFCVTGTLLIKLQNTNLRDVIT